MKPAKPRGHDDLVDALVAASRALVAVAVRSLVQASGDVSLAQYRVLVELAERGPQRVADLAGVLGVEPSTVTRMCDRLERKRLVTRDRSTKDRRAVTISLGPPGHALVKDVTHRRRAELTSFARRLPSDGRRAVLAALRAFAEAAGEVPEQEWSLGWR